MYDHGMQRSKRRRRVREQAAGSWAQPTSALLSLLTCQQSAVLLAGQGFHFDTTGASDTRTDRCRRTRNYAPRPHTVPHCATAVARDTCLGATDLPAERVPLAGQATRQTQLDAPALDRRRRLLRAHPHILHACDSAAATTPAHNAQPRIARRHTCYAYTHASQAYTNITWTGRRCDSRQHGTPLEPHAAPRPPTYMAAGL